MKVSSSNKSMEKEWRKLSDQKQMKQRILEQIIRIETIQQKGWMVK